MRPKYVEHTTKRTQSVDQCLLLGHLQHEGSVSVQLDGPVSVQLEGLVAVKLDGPVTTEPEGPFVTSLEIRSPTVYACNSKRKETFLLRQSFALCFAMQDAV